MAILLVLLVPLGYFIRRTQDPLDTVATPALAGTVVVGMYILCGLTDNVFYRAMPHSLYFFLVLGFAVSIAQRQYTRFHADGFPEKHGPHQSDRME
jgi:O-antigen ligase